ncbi:MAG: RNA-binding protein [Candidatus Thorarchaeota archaeon]|nr:RNA-binding protein [Candidatus Thorarchaeota archaeon]
MEILQKSVGSQILVEIKGRRKLRGRLRGYDQHLNLIIEDADEITRDSENGTESVAQVNTVIVRGDNVVLVSPPPKSTAQE